MAHYFYKYYFKSFKFIKDLRPYAEGIRHGKQIKFKACKDILVPYPSIEEQEKIGGYLSLLDLIKFKKINIRHNWTLNLNFQCFSSFLAFTNITMWTFSLACYQKNNIIFLRSFNKRVNILF